MVVHIQACFLKQTQYESSTIFLSNYIYGSSTWAHSTTGDINKYCHHKASLSLFNLIPSGLVSN